MEGREAVSGEERKGEEREGGKKRGREGGHLGRKSLMDIPSSLKEILN